MMITTSLARLVFVLGLATASGCGDVKSSGPAAKCVRIGDQCKLPTGPLGVCSAVDCKADEVPPCMVCMSQH